MKILFVLDKPNLYGSEQHVLKLLRALRNEYEVSLLAFNDGPLLNMLDSDNIPFFIIKMKWYSITRLLKLTKFLKKNNFSIVHAHQPKALFWSAIAAKLASIPSIVTIHSLPSNNMQSHKNVVVKSVVGMFHYAIKLLSELLAHKIIYLSRFSYQHAFFKKKSMIIPNWVDKIIGDDQLKLYFNDTVRFISVGSVTFNKGMDRMIESLALVKNEKWTIRILGDYSLEFKNELMDSAINYKISDRIEFMGYVNNVDQLMLESDAFMLMSRGETFGLAYIEAMNCGLPIIAWDIPIIHEIIPSGNLIMSEFIEIKKVFTEILYSQENYRMLSLANKDFVKANYSLDKIYFKYRNLYDQILYNNRN